MNSNKSDVLGPDLVVQAYGIDRACGRPAPWIRPLDWTPKGIPWVWRHMRGFLKSRCDSHAPSLNKFTSFGESFLRLYCSVRYVLQLKVTFHVCPCIPTYISRLKSAFATLPAQLPALKLRHQNDHIQNEPPGSRFNTRDGSIREMGL